MVHVRRQTLFASLLTSLRCLASSSDVQLFQRSMFQAVAGELIPYVLCMSLLLLCLLLIIAFFFS